MNKDFLFYEWIHQEHTQIHADFVDIALSKETLTLKPNKTSTSPFPCQETP